MIKKLSIGDVCYRSLMWILMVISVIPLLWVIRTAFIPSGKALDLFALAAPTLENIRHVFETVPFLQYYGNTILITLMVLAVSAVALTVPASFEWISTKAITPMLGVVMFGMGLTLKPSDFKPVLLHPRDILIGELAQFIIMPLMAWTLCKALSLPTELAIGVILVGCCPGGTASNVICYLAKGDIALSVAMTGVSTLLAPLLTPALVLLLAGQSVDVDVWGMFVSIIQVVILPIALGFAANHYLRQATERIVPLLPMFSPYPLPLSSASSWHIMRQAYVLAA